LGVHRKVNFALLCGKVERVDHSAAGLRLALAVISEKQG
jgi:hypothetical protein